MGGGKIKKGAWQPLLLLAVACIGSAILAYRLGQRSMTGPDAAAAVAAPEAGPAGDRLDSNLASVARGHEEAEPAAAEPISPVLFAQVMRERAAELDRNFLEDPVAPAWASAMEADIEDVIAKSGYLGEADYGIAGHRVECRSRGCEVSLDFAKEGLAEEATALLRMAMSSHFSQALTVPLRNPDGSVQYRVYMVKADAGELLRKRTATRTNSADVAG